MPTTEFFRIWRHLVLVHLECWNKRPNLSWQNGRGLRWHCRVPWIIGKSQALNRWAVRRISIWRGNQFWTKSTFCQWLFCHHWTSHVAFSVKIILIRPSSIQYADSDIGLSIQSISRNVRSHSRLSTIFIVSYQCWLRADLSLLMGSSAPTADGPAIWTERGSWKCFHDRHQSKLDVSATCGPCLGGFLIGVRLPLFSKDAAPVNLTRYFSIHLLHPQRLFHRVCDDASRFFSTRVTHAAAVWKIAVNYQWSRK